MFFKLPAGSIEKLTAEGHLAEKGGQPQAQGEGENKDDPVGVQGCPPAANEAKAAI